MSANGASVGLSRRSADGHAQATPANAAAIIQSDGIAEDEHQRRPSGAAG